MIFTAKQKYEARDYLNGLLNEGHEVSIAKHRRIRSLNQNRLMWLWFTCLEHETGNDRMWLHDYYVEKFLPPETYTVKSADGKVLKVITRRAKTSELDTLNFKIFLDKVKQDAELEFAGLELPNPGDKYFDQFVEHYSRYQNHAA